MDDKLSLVQWFIGNSYLILGGLLALAALAFNRVPSMASWQSFLDSFESKGGQLMLLWITDFIVLTVLVRYWKGFDAQLQTTIVGLLSGINGAFLGAVGARQTPANGNGYNGNGGNGVAPVPNSPTPQPPAAPILTQPLTSAAQPAAGMGFAPQPARHIGHVGDRGDHGDLGTNNSRRGS